MEEAAAPAASLAAVLAAEDAVVLPAQALKETVIVAARKNAANFDIFFILITLR